MPTGARVKRPYAAAQVLSLEQKKCCSPYLFWFIVFFLLSLLHFFLTQYTKQCSVIVIQNRRVSVCFPGVIHKGALDFHFKNRLGQFPPVIQFEAVLYLSCFNIQQFRTGNVEIHSYLQREMRCTRFSALTESRGIWKMESLERVTSRN